MSLRLQKEQKASSVGTTSYRVTPARNVLPLLHSAIIRSSVRTDRMRPIVLVVPWLGWPSGVTVSLIVLAVKMSWAVSIVRKTHSVATTGIVARVKQLAFNLTNDVISPMTVIMAKMRLTVLYSLILWMNIRITWSRMVTVSCITITRANGIPYVTLVSRIL
uniref:Uncharacterized protein n=1 Tax=Cacopsylla melanoneura TaxID=428564 RepID=A0A8D8QRH1_9HEMI